MSTATQCLQQGPVDAYVAGLNRALRGPRRRKADLMAEARDSLEDATEAYEADGLDRDEAERRAVADFGDLGEIVPGYRAELGLAQSRRTAVLLFLVMIAQPIVWQEGAWAWTQQPDAAMPLLDVVQQAVRVVGTLAIAGAFVALLGTGLGLRYPWLRDRAARATALFALVCAVLVGAMATVMGLFSSELGGSDLAGLGVVGGFVLLPLTLVSYSAQRCLRLA
ncbi:permease prefix domain 1-containing protein [Kribbella flavida]|uniref:permease prefix domain 1-containing protein n=1 Tax=Kribbella flavida TaxID=182640 RepID=UPI000674631E|nr:permease prefix domain 1-containing protein [Kribbella flavida]